jgi:hypothetical protein
MYSNSLGNNAAIVVSTLGCAKKSIKDIRGSEVLAPMGRFPALGNDIFVVI